MLGVWGWNSRVWRDSNVYCSEVLTNFLWLLSSKNRCISGTSTRDNEALTLRFSYCELYIFKASILRDKWLFLERGWQRTYLNPWWEVCCGFCQHQLDLFAIRKVIGDSVGINWSVFPKWGTFLKCLNREQTEDIKASFNSLFWLFWWLLSNSRILSSFWETEILTWYLSNKWMGWWN